MCILNSLPISIQRIFSPRERYRHMCASRSISQVDEYICYHTLLTAISTADAIGNSAKSGMNEVKINYIVISIRTADTSAVYDSTNIC